ncbi:M48 family metallopeptidase [Demequina sp. SO4-18]|uniref:M48 family metallopeptidase n=1 Tax=Demequina sp. SO4-18 TaxID=3401026 RepID=UPI003B5C7077
MSRDQAEYRSAAPSLEYTLIRKRMRTMRMRVIPPDGEIRVSAPWTSPQWEIDQFVSSRRDWIASRRAMLVGMEPRLEHGPEAAALRAQLAEWLEILLPRWCAEFDVATPHISLRIMRTQWGSCRPTTRRITLNIELARRGYDMAEYVLVHELCHLFANGHGRDFYALMDYHLPDWRDRRRRLGPL